MTSGASDLVCSKFVLKPLEILQFQQISDRNSYYYM